ncbi:hypothetical protein BJY01DRAFT_250554 [Aspergillus pseudoustus]|uniref:Poly [ADP-ribose] polymerase n=1 Tax=Aspergillus pseudoustus TaxID=1810923 RepID=A0ABR4JH59_9EURO
MRQRPSHRPFYSTTPLPSNTTISSTILQMSQSTAAQSPLAGCAISFSGYFGAWKQGTLMETAERLGATLAKKVGHGCTHLITTQREVRNVSAQVSRANRVPGCEKVSVYWLFTVELLKSPVAVDTYRIVVAPSAPTNTTINTNSADRNAANAPSQIAGRKRRRSPCTEGDDELVLSKKRQTMTRRTAATPIPTSTTSTAVSVPTPVAGTKRSLPSSMEGNDAGRQKRMRATPRSNSSPSETAFGNRPARSVKIPNTRHRAEAGSQFRSVSLSQPEDKDAPNELLISREKLYALRPMMKLKPMLEKAIKKEVSSLEYRTAQLQKYTQRNAIPAHHADRKEEGWTVYVDSQGVIWDALCIKSISGTQKNDFVRLQLLTHPHLTTFRVESFRGRIGNQHSWTSDVFTDDISHAKLRFREKFLHHTGTHFDSRQYQDARPDKYCYIGAGKTELYMHPVPNCSLSPDVRIALRKMLPAWTETHPTPELVPYDEALLPLGPLNKQTILDGYGVLLKLAAVLDSVETMGMYQRYLALDNLSSIYLSTIPTVFDYKGYTPTLCTDADFFKEAQRLVYMAQYALDRDAPVPPGFSIPPVHPLDQQFRGLGLDEMTLVDPASNESQLVKRYFNSSSGYWKHEVSNIFRISRRDEAARFNASTHAHALPSTRRLLWHGTATGNIGAILREGLRIAPSGHAANGAAMGLGVYFSDWAGVSSQYSSASMIRNIGGGGSDPQLPKTGFLFLADVELGRVTENGSPADVMLKGWLASLGNGADTGTRSDGGSESGIGIDGYVPLQTFATSDRVKASWRRWTSAAEVHHRLAKAKVPDTALGPGTQYAVFDEAQVQLRYLVEIQTALD